MSATFRYRGNAGKHWSHIFEYFYFQKIRGNISNIRGNISNIRVFFVLRKSGDSLDECFLVFLVSRCAGPEHSA